MAIHEWIARGAVSDDIAKQRGYIELVRCKDCYAFTMTGKIMDKDIPKSPFCKRLYRLVSEDWFCADGERNDTK